jgi:hypothetical protein
LEIPLPQKRTKKATPEYSTYTLKKMDRSMWSAFTAKCKKDGREVKYVMLKMITTYANGEFQIQS